MASVPFRNILFLHSLRKENYKIGVVTNVLAFVVEKRALRTYILSKKNNNKKQKRSFTEFPKHKKPSNFLILEKTKLILKWYCWGSIAS
jgi:hypothetical protein